MESKPQSRALDRGWQPVAGERCGAVVAADLAAAELTAVRRLLWPRLAGVGAAWLALGAVALPRIAVATGLSTFALVGIGVRIAEWRARVRLFTLLAPVAGPVTPYRPPTLRSRLLGAIEGVDAASRGRPRPS